MKKKENGLINCIKNNSLAINTFVIYFYVISMFLFLTTDFFRYVKIPFIIVTLYVIIYSCLIKFKNIKPIIKNSFFIWYVVFWLFIIIMTLCRNSSQLLLVSKNFIVFSMYIFGLLSLFEDKKVKSKFDYFKMIRITSLVLCAWILIFEFNNLLDGERIGFSIITKNPNGAGTVLSILFFAMVYIIKKSRRKSDIALIIILLVFIFATGSKHAIIMCAISLVYFIFKNGKLLKKRLLIFLISICLSIGLVFAVPYLRKNVGERFLKLLGTMNIINYEKDYSSTQRVKYSDRAVELWLETPVLGGGYDNVIVNSGYNTYSHNNYLVVLCTFGMIGFIIYYGYILYLFVCTCKKIKNGHYRIREKNIIVLLLILSIIISDVGAITFSLYPFYYIIWYLIDKKNGLFLTGVDGINITINKKSEVNYEA